MSTLDRESLGLLGRLRKFQPEIFFFVHDCSLIAPSGIVEFIESRDVEDRLTSFNHTTLLLLLEVLHSIRTNLETRNRHLEAASWDILADRISDELTKRSGPSARLRSTN